MYCFTRGRPASSAHSSTMPVFVFLSGLLTFVTMTSAVVLDPRIRAQLFEKEASDNLGSRQETTTQREQNKMGHVRAYDPAVDCPIRELAFDYARKILAEDANGKCLPIQPIYDSLGLARCGTAPLRGDSARVRTCKQQQSWESILGERWWLGEDEADNLLVFIDPKRGNDAHGSGAKHNPFRTLRAGLEMARSGGKHVSGASSDVKRRRLLVLREGTHYLDRTLDVAAEDEGTVLVSYPGEDAVISGGKVLDVDFTPWECPALSSQVPGSGGEGVHRAGGKSCWKASLVGMGLEAGGASNGDMGSKEKDRRRSARFAFNQLFVAGERAVRARAPNGNPETTGLHTNPTGYFPKPSKPYGDLPDIETPPAVELVQKDIRTYSLFRSFGVGVGGPVEVFEPPVSYWGTRSPQGGGGSTFSRFQGMDVDPALLPKSTWRMSPRDPPIVHVFHSGHWGNWQYALNSSSVPSAGKLRWTYGGFQEARGSTGNGGQEWYVENDLALLDSPNEWFFDGQSEMLFLMVEGSTPPARGSVIAGGLRTLIHVRGDSAADPARGFMLLGITFRHSSSTFMLPYRVPSGGDWSYHHGAMITIEDAEDIAIKGCTFDRPGGNALLLGGYIRQAKVTGNLFQRAGDSAIVLAGWAKDSDGTGPDHPSGTLIGWNLAYGMGVWGKQTGFLYQALSARTALTANVAFDGPRAGICFNDGFGGGHEVSRNLLFNFVRETGDHGPFNSWDRQPFFTTYRTGSPSTTPQDSHLRQNFFINDFRSVWPIDHDDGSAFFRDTGNLLVYGGFKTYLGDHHWVTGNLYLWPDISTERGFGASTCAGYYASNGNETWGNNTCVRLRKGPAYQDFGCNTSNPIASPVTFQNTFFSPDAEWYFTCRDLKKNVSLQQFQQLGYDAGSVVKTLPSIPDVMAMAKRVLQVDAAPLHEDAVA